MFIQHKTQEQASDMTMEDPVIANNIGIDATDVGVLSLINGKFVKKYIISCDKFPYKVATPIWVNYNNIFVHQNVPAPPGHAVLPVPNVVKQILIGETGSMNSFSTFMKQHNFNNLMKVYYSFRFVAPFWVCLVFWMLLYFLLYQ